MRVSDEDKTPCAIWVFLLSTAYPLKGLHFTNIEHLISYPLFSSSPIFEKELFSEISVSGKRERGRSKTTSVIGAIGLTT